MSLPKTYKAAVIEEANAPFKIKDIEYKSPESGKVVIKVVASGVCHSDSLVVEQQMPTGLPRVPGHEIVGRVVEVAQDEKRWKVGDLVGSGWHGGHCGGCSRCVRGDFNTCENEARNGILSDGGHAEYATLRTEALCSIPEDIEPAKAAPLLCAGLTVFNSLRNMSLHPGDVVAVQGVGGLGHLAIQFARKMGYVVAAVSRGDSKKQLALDLGAHHYIDSEDGDPAEALLKLGGAKAIAAVAPNGAAMASLIPGLAVNGQLIVLAPVEKLEVPTVLMIGKRLSVRGWPSGHAGDSEDTIKFAQTMGVDCKVETYPLERIQDAYDSMMNNKARFRSVIVFE
ncbi:uncharacterized protein JCM10292_004876 [Rhodotorula paludigena]|uniref:uncharacterized protein n=1 Tax=Rhodotorula paludigena TaxID=86838 RepID=UPI00316B259B